MTELCVTGASGFLGRHFVATCLSRDNIFLRLLTRDASAVKGPPADRVEIVKGDLNDSSSLEGFLREGSVLVHLAYLHEGNSPNLAAASNIARAAVEARVKRVVHCSTAVVVGFGARGVVDERTPPAPKGEYQETKYRIEQLLREHLGQWVELAILRPTEIIGAGGEGLRAMIRRLADGSESRNSLYRLLLGNRRFNYVSVENVVGALLLLALAPAVQTGDVYNVSDDDDPDNRYDQVEQIIRSAIGKSPSNRGPSLPPGMLSLLFRLIPGSAPPSRVYSAAKLTTLGYRKTKSLRSSILDVITHEVGHPTADKRREPTPGSNGSDHIRPTKHAN